MLMMMKGEEMGNEEEGKKKKGEGRGRNLRRFS